MQCFSEFSNGEQFCFGSRELDSQLLFNSVSMTLARGAAKLDDSVLALSDLKAPDQTGSCFRHHPQLQLHATTSPMVGEYIAVPGIITDHGSRIADINVHVSFYASDMFS